MSNVECRMTVGRRGLRRAKRSRGLLVVAAAVALTGRSGFAGDDGEHFVVIHAGRVITVSGEEFRPGTVVIADGKVRLVGGREVEAPDGAEVIDAPAETIMPGMVHPRTRFGLPGYNRRGVHGDLRAADEMYPALIEFDELLKNGFTAAAFYPDGTGATGVATVYRTGGPDGPAPILDASYLRVTFNDTGRDKRVLRGAFEKAKKEIEKVKKAREEWDKKQKEKAEAKKKEEEEKKKQEQKPPPKPEGGKSAEGITDAGAGGEPVEVTASSNIAATDLAAPPKKDDEAKAEAPKEEVFTPPPIDPAHQPFVDLIQKEAKVPVLIELGAASDLRHLDDVLKPYEDVAHQYYLTPNYLTDYHHIIEDLGQRKAQVVIGPRVDYMRDSVVRYNVADRLNRAGCTVAFEPLADWPTEYERVRARVADLVRAGLSREAALKAMTLHPARVVGLGDSLGSLEKGKDADIVFFDSDPLVPESRVTRVMIGGKIVWEDESR